MGSRENGKILIAIMNSKELVTLALRGEPTPRVPTGPLAVHFCAGVAGYTLRQYSSDPRALADSVIRYYERFKPDAIWLSADTWVSAEAMGARVGAIDDNQPFGGVDGPVIRSAADIDRIPAPDVSTQGRYPLMLEALSRITAELGREVFIVGCFDQYPFSLAAALMGINEIMLQVYDDPPFVEALMQRCAEYAVAYARALDCAGADMLSGGDSPAGLLGPRLYAEFALPAERRVVAELKKAGRKPVSLHICGNASPFLSHMVATGADVLELDHAVQMDQACRIVGPEVGLWANLDPVRVLLQGTPETVAEEAGKVLAAVKQAGHRRFVLSSGCTLAVGTPGANIEALIAAPNRCLPLTPQLT
jgi:MtaA/CmuA family methyltransferase